jgi:glycerophosphoryl diester phosphodiesterase
MIPKSGGRFSDKIMRQQKVPDWLTARPVAHRGLHDGVSLIENTASAFKAAIDGGFAIGA